MSPLQLTILIHYHDGGASDFRDGDFHAPAAGQAIDEFMADGMLECEPDPARAGRTYRLTERGAFFVRYLCEIDRPVANWSIPERPF